MMKKLGILLLICLAIPAFCGEPGSNPPAKVIITQPGPLAGPPAFPELPETVRVDSSALEGRRIDFELPPDKSYDRKRTFSVGQAFGSLAAIPGWIISSALDLVAGTLNAGGQGLSVVTGTGLGVLEAGSGALVDTGEIVELGTNKVAGRIADETGGCD